MNDRPRDLQVGTSGRSRSSQAGARYSPQPDQLAKWSDRLV